MPTIYELQTILLAAYPCASSPCIDPVFGPTVADYYWSATTRAPAPNFAWDVSFNDGFVNDFGKLFDGAVRAVRAGL